MLSPSMLSSHNAMYSFHSCCLLLKLFFELLFYNCILKWTLSFEYSLWCFRESQDWSKPCLVKRRVLQPGNLFTSLPPSLPLSFSLSLPSSLLSLSPPSFPPFPPFPSPPPFFLASKQEMRLNFLHLINFL